MYSVYGSKQEDSRILMVPRNEQHRWKFFKKVGDKRTPLKLKGEGGSLYALLDTRTEVWKKPSAHDYHWEVMRLNSRQFFVNGAVDNPQPVMPDYDALLENMLEFVEAI